MNQIIFQQLNFDQERPFLFDSITDHVFSRKEIRRRAMGIANYLTSRNIGKGDPVAVILPTSWECVCVYFALIFIGAVTVPLSPNYNDVDYQYILAKAGVRAVISSKEITDGKQYALEYKNMLIDMAVHFAELYGDNHLNEEVLYNWNDPVAVIFTSGTTGKPKGVVMKAGAILENLSQYGSDMQFDESSRFMQVIPLFHAHGWLYSVVVPSIFGSSVVLNEPFSTKVCAKFWDIVCRYDADILISVPSILSSLYEFKDRYKEEYFSKLRYIVSGSAFLHPHFKEKFENTFGSFIYEFYGSTETLYIAYHSPAQDFVMGSVGKLLPNCTAKIAYDGEIVVKTKYIFKEYMNEKQLTEEAFQGDWYLTGDVGYISDDGYVFLTGRKKEIINKGGYKVSPKEINTCLMNHHDVVDAATIGIPDEAYGEEICSFVVPKHPKSIDCNLLMEFCSENLHPTICPRVIVKVDQIPRNHAGKIDQQKLLHIFEKHIHEDRKI